MLTSFQSLSRGGKIVNFNEKSALNIYFYKNSLISRSNLFYNVVVVAA